jgi:hypothetical protein
VMTSGQGTEETHSGVSSLNLGLEIWEKGS